MARYIMGDAVRFTVIVVFERGIKRSVLVKRIVFVFPLFCFLPLPVSESRTVLAGWVERVVDGEGLERKRKRKNISNDGIQHPLHCWVLLPNFKSPILSFPILSLKTHYYHE
jgi:hypothetical protein